MKKKHTAQSGSFSLKLVLCSVAVCSMITGTLLAFFHPEAPAKSSHPADAGLTFAERVAYQRAIEEVYWRHRIWPSERSDPKPSLETVMSQAELENKVTDYLQKSQALEDYWQRPITAEQLQAEMDRMAEHTKQPEVLCELFEALGNDPFIVAECLARPVLTDRSVANCSGQDKARGLEAAPTKALRTVSMALTSANVSYTLPEISAGGIHCVDDTWRATSTTNAPTGRAYHTSVWTGSEMIVWGGYDLSNYFYTGGRYNPSTDSWAATSTTNAPSGRHGHTAVWTGTEMVIWGGTDENFVRLNTGGRYNPGTNSWTPTSITHAPSGRYQHTAVWTGSTMIVWGGGTDYYGDNYFNTGGRYNPGTDSWTATSTANAPDARWQHTAVWTGSEMIVWGGYFFDNNGGHYLDTGGRYDPRMDSWKPTTTTDAPSARTYHTAVWTGSEMIVWGGSYANTGGRYDPGTDSWTPTSTTAAPYARQWHTAIWTGREMIVCGGWPFSLADDGEMNPNGGTPTPTPTPTATPTASPTPTFVTGGRYNPDTDSWTATSLRDAPSGRAYHTSVWTDSEMIAWGGLFFDVGNHYLNTGGRYCAASGVTPTPTPTATATLPPSPTPTATPTPSEPPVTPSPTPTTTGTPTPAPRVTPTPRPHPTRPPRP